MAHLVSPLEVLLVCARLLCHIHTALTIVLAVVLGLPSRLHNVPPSAQIFVRNVSCYIYYGTLAHNIEH